MTATRAGPTRRSASGRTCTRRSEEGRVAELERRIVELEARLAALERRVTPSVVPDVGPPCCSDDIIGCLDDCVVDVKELRKKVRDARSTARRH